MKVERFGKITLINGDCMEFMQSKNDKSFDLAIVDPPYGIDAGSNKRAGTQTGKSLAKKNIYHSGDWDKDNGTNYYADCEIAWTSFDSAVRKFRWRWHGFLQENNKNKQIKIHPTEKPIALYSWLLQNYAQKGQKILDTHGGSMSHAIAAHDMGFDLTIIEKDPIYYEQAKKDLLNTKEICHYLSYENRLHYWN